MMQKRIFKLFLIVVLCTECLSSELPTPCKNGDAKFWITIKASTIEERTTLAALGMSLDEIDEGEVSGIATKDIIDDLGRNKVEICSCESLELQSKALLRPEFYRFLHYGAMVAQAQQLAATYPDFISLLSAGKSIQGRELIVIRINTAEKGTQLSVKPGILIIGNHHAREHITAEFCMQLAFYLANNKDDPFINSLIAKSDIFIMPMANPDGVEYDLSAFPYKYHRKNMRRFPNSALGVDLNRNYDLDWGGIGSSKRPNSETYCGPRAFSEPETTAIKSLIESHANIGIVLSYHSFGKLILYPWGYTRKQIENKDDYQKYVTLTKEMSARLPDYRVLQASDLYLVSGEATDWSYANHKLFALTIEMMPRMPHSASGFYPTDKKEIAEDINNNIKAALYAIEFAGTLIKNKH